MKPSLIVAKAELLSQLRRFFTDRGFTEVVTPVASREVIPERHIELIQIGIGGIEKRDVDQGDRHAGSWPAARGGVGQDASQSPPFSINLPIYLQASPEMAMKRLLCLGTGAIFQIGPAFRAEERGPLHSPEFTMVEWYRPAHDMAAAMDLLDELVRATLGTRPCKRTSYRQAFLEHAGCDPFVGSAVRTVVGTLPDHDGQSANHGPHSGPYDELLNLLMVKRVESNLGRERPEILYHYPAGQSALAQTTVDEHGNAVAERFELYYHGVELANGYHELTDAAALRQRLVEANEGRVADGREPLPLPEELLRLMVEPGLPACAGVALGFDRLLMLKVGAESIDEVT